MTNHFFKITTFWLLLSCLFFSCARPRPDIISDRSVLRIAEGEDHQKCVAQGFDLNKWDDIVTELYWSCRYDLIQKRRIYDNSTDPEVIANNIKVKKISDEILKNLNRARQVVLAKLQGNIQTSDHAKCVSLGYNLDSENPAEIESYYKCREGLVLGRISPAPKVTNSYEASVMPDDKTSRYLQIVKEARRDNPEVIKIDEQINLYPMCAGLNVRSEDFKKCASAQEDAKKCFLDINLRRARKNVDDKIYCQKQAFIQFPDNYALIKDRSPAQIASDKKKAKEAEAKKAKEKEEQVKTNLTLMFLQGGSTSDVLNMESVRNEKADKKEETKILYGKIELLNLREQFIERCNISMEQKMPIFIEEEAAKCTKIGVDWDVSN